MADPAASAWLSRPQTPRPTAAMPLAGMVAILGAFFGMAAVHPATPFPRVLLLWTQLPRVIALKKLHESQATALGAALVMAGKDAGIERLLADLEREVSRG